MKVEVLLPQWGMGMSEGTVTTWFKKVGDRVTEDEPLAEIEAEDRKSTRLNSSHLRLSRMPSSA